MRNLLVLLTLLALMMVSSEAGAQGAIDNTTIGLTTPQAGKFTNLETDTLEATTSIKLGTETITNFSGIDDDRVKASSGDTAPGFLDSKIVAGSGVTVTAGTNTITIAAPPVNVEDSADGVEITFARESDSVIDLNGTALFIGSTDPTVTLGGQARTVLSKGTIPNTTPALQQVVVDLPFALLDGNHKLKLSNTSGFSEGLIPLSSIGNDSFVKLLLHADGTGNAFTDSSASAKAITTVGNVTQSSAQSQLGGKSALFDGTGDYLTVPDSDDWNFGADNFTIDLWIKPTSTSPSIQENFVSQWPSNGNVAFIFGRYPSNKVVFGYTNNGVYENQVVVSTNTLSGNWQHLALVRNGSDLKLYIDGVEDTGFAYNISNESIYNSSGNLYIGTQQSSVTQYWDGYIDELRISKGIARWTANFTPPAAPYN
jgi:hypothetical protein